MINRECMGQTDNETVHLSVRASVCLFSLSWVYFVIDCHEKWHSNNNRKVRTSSLRVNIGSSLIIPQNCPKEAPICVFQPNQQSHKIAISGSCGTGSLCHWQGRHEGEGNVTRDPTWRITNPRWRTVAILEIHKQVCLHGPLLDRFAPDLVCW